MWSLRSWFTLSWHTPYLEFPQVLEHVYFSSRSFFLVGGLEYLRTEFFSNFGFLFLAVSFSLVISSSKLVLGNFLARFNLCIGIRLWLVTRKRKTQKSEIYIFQFYFLFRFRSDRHTYIAKEWEVYLFSGVIIESM